MVALHRFFSTLSLAALPALAAAGVVEIGDDINARIARAKVQQSATVAERAGGVAPGAGLVALGSAGAPGAGRAAGCNIAIGNVFEDRSRGVSTSARRETTVIVTGDVIQVGNNCR